MTELRWENFRRRWARYVALRQLRHEDMSITSQFAEQFDFFSESYHDDEDDEFETQDISKEVRGK